MLTSLYTAISGMDANGTALAVVGDNIANLNTTGFKESVVNFGNVLSQTLTGGAGSSQVGRGVRIDSVLAQFSQGSFQTTSNALDLAIDGDGLFEVSNGSGNFYTRAGAFSMDKTGHVVNAEGFTLQGYMADNTGKITGTTGDITISNQGSEACATTAAQIAVNLNATDKAQTNAFSVDGKGDGSNDTPINYNESTTIKVYDSLGGAHNVTLYFCKTGDGAWTVNYVNTDPTDSNKLVIAGTQNLTFGTDGSLTDDSSGTAVSFDFGTAVKTPEDIKFDFGTGTGETPAGTGFDGTTQFSSSFSVNSMNQDGYGAGTVSNISIGQDGIITASFTNGQSRTLAQIALARFLDPASLNKLGENLYEETPASGQAVVAKPGTSGTGRILSDTLELSNTDLAVEFVKLISAQRAFQANSRMITTTDEIFQDLINLKR